MDEQACRIMSSEAQIAHLQRELQRRDADLAMLTRRLQSAPRPSTADTTASRREEAAQRERAEHDSALQRIAHEQAQRADVLQSRIDVLRRALAGGNLSDAELEAAGLTRDEVSGRPSTPSTRRPGTPIRRPGTPSTRRTPSHAQGVTSGPLTAADIAAFNNQGGAQGFEPWMRASATRLASDVQALGTEVAAYATTAQELRAAVAGAAGRAVVQFDQALSALPPAKLSKLLENDAFGTALARTQSLVMTAVECTGEGAMAAQLAAMEGVAECACALLAL